MADEPAGVDVDDVQRLGRFDHDVAAGGEPHLAIEGLPQLVLDVESLEQRQFVLVMPHVLRQLGGGALEVGDDALVGVGVVDEQPAEVARVVLANDPDLQRRLFVEQGRGARAGGFLLNGGPGLLETRHVRSQVALAGAGRSGSDDDPGVVRPDGADDAPQAFPLVVGQPAADATHVGGGSQDQVAAREADLVGEPGSLVAHRVLHDLHHEVVAGFERLLDPRPAFAELLRVVLDVAGVENPVLALSEVDERRLHARQHVAHLAQIDVADQRLLVGAGHVVLDEHRALEDDDLCLVGQGPHQHLLALRLRRGDQLELGPGTPLARRSLPSAFRGAALLLGRARLRSLGFTLGLGLRRLRPRPDAANLHRCAADLAGLALLHGRVAHALAHDDGPLPSKQCHSKPLLCAGCGWRRAPRIVMLLLAEVARPPGCWSRSWRRRIRGTHRSAATTREVECCT